MDGDSEAQGLVADALDVVQYRVYPDTPLAEVMDLIVRRDLRALPVVGERYEVLGIITSGDALNHFLRKGREGLEEISGEGDVLRARDVMTRTVLCVSEDQPLSEAANMIVNREVDQLPVVREGEFVGFITRDSILKALYGDPEDADDTNDEGDT